jgi:hypothetical protein
LSVSVVIEPNRICGKLWITSIGQRRDLFKQLVFTECGEIDIDRTVIVEVGCGASDTVYGMSRSEPEVMSAKVPLPWL